MENQELYDLRNEFLRTWSLERVKKMAIDEYTNLNKDDSFCYWLEKKTEILGSIWGGSSFKFGIYKRKNTDREFEKNAISDGEYAWLDKYGKERDEAFNNVKNIIIDIITKSQAGDFKAIDSIDFGNATRWKIAYLYSNNHILNVFSKEKLLKIAKRLGIEFDKNISFYNLQNLVFEKKTAEEDYFTFARRIWKVVEKDKIDDIISLLHYKPQIILQGPPGTGKTREAKRIAKALLGLGENDSLKGNEQFKLIQFHPSYSYEDFVRGIIAENTDDNISYVTKDKILAEFAKKALEDPYELIKWEDFRDYLIKEREKNENVFFDKKETIKFDSIKKYDDGEAIHVQCLENNKWKVGENGLNLPKNFTNENLYDNFVTFKENQKKKDGYWSDIVDYFIDWAKKFKKKPYVLVIDEINRANLSAVLGELIYALEYRGEAVQSMYAIEGENNLILPPNLYIIGTMNTADRSVGHIDYAIRRRFAFVNVLPKELEKDFHKELFRAVGELFISNYDEYISNPDIELKRALTLSNEFKSEDVWLGHSYFITKNTPIDIRWEYEIKPILLEYIKDGILINDIKIGEQMQKIKKIVYENTAS
ncbi:McrB family protein [Capnocytophaga leadbetteri]|uniref:McrB family protein n=1 Tax=Capnocytophaga leadbetteri TaxID=327575 RepID=UPI0028D7F331|nr:AAA family ATPase [Capnocytophaga leadbetteri]